MEETYYQKHRAECLEKVKAHRNANKSYYQAQFRTWYLKNRDTVLAKQKQRKLTGKRIVKQASPKQESPVELPVFPTEIPESTVKFVDHDFVVSFA